MDDWRLISKYTRAQALEDGTLMDTGDLAQEAGWKIPVALTAAAWAGCVAWEGDDQGQSVTGRLWDLLNVARFVAGKNPNNSQIRFTVHVIPQGGERPVPHHLIADVGPGDAAEPVLTIGYPDDF